MALKVSAEDLKSGWLYETFQERQCISLARSFPFAQLDQVVGGRCGTNLFTESNQFFHDVIKRWIFLDISPWLFMQIPRIFLVVIKVSEFFNKHIAFDFKCDLVWINLSWCYPLKVWYLCLSLLLNIILIVSTAKKTRGLSFCSRLKIFVSFFVFFAVKKVNFLGWKNFSSFKDSNDALIKVQKVP